VSLAARWPAVGVAALLIWVAVPRTAPGCLIFWPPNPAVSVLAALASNPDPATLAKAVERTVHVRDRCGGCVPRVGWVLLSYSRGGEAQRALVLKALTLLADSPTESVRDMASDFKACVESGVGCEIVARATPRGMLVEGYPPTEAIGRVPPTRAERYSRSSPFYEERLDLYLDSVLPDQGLDRIEAAVCSLAATTCDDFLGGKAIDACRDLGLPELQRSSMTAAIRELASAPVDAMTIDFVLGLDQPTFDEIVNRLGSSQCCGCGAPELANIFVYWRLRRPTEIEAWRDVESAFRPDGP
jgi:hypothetical protein